jgi:hypothetical protein
MSHLDQAAARIGQYRALRRVQQALVEQMIGFLTAEDLDRSARALGFWEAGRPALRDPMHAALVYEVALYDDRDEEGVSLIERAASANPGVEVLAAMASARVDFWQVEEVRAQAAALRVVSRLAGRALWLTDEGLGQSAAAGDVLVLRPLQVGALALTSGVALPIPASLVEPTVAALIMGAGVGGAEELATLPPAEASLCAVSLLSLSAAAGATARLRPR